MGRKYYFIYCIDNKLKADQCTFRDASKTLFVIEEILEDFKFVPGGRIMHGAGREDITTTLNNCYVVAIRNDSIKSIYDTIIDEALTYKYGGGCGRDLSVLRPAGKEINGTGGELGLISILCIKLDE